MGKNKQKIKILFICAVDLTVESFLLPLIDRLIVEGYEVKTLCSYGPRTAKLQKMGYKIKNITILRKIRPVSNLLSIIRIYRYIKKDKFDIVHVYTPIASIIGRIAAKLAKVPIIIYSSLGFYFHDNMIWWRKKTFILIEKLSAKFTDFIFTVSNEDEKTAIKERIIHRNKIISLNGIGVDTDKFSMKMIAKEIVIKRKKELMIINAQKIIGYLGRILKEKGVIDLLEAFLITKKTIPETKLLLIGGNLYMERDTKTKCNIKAFIESHGLKEDVIITGFTEDVREYLAMIDVLVLPSYREGMPKSILEAMAMAKPVVATNIRGCREELVDGVTGFLVPAKDPNALSKAIIKILTNENLALKMGKEGRRRAEELFDEKIVINKQIKVYRNLL